MVEDFSTAGALNAFFLLHFFQTQFSGKWCTSEASLCVVTTHHMSLCVTLLSHPAPYALTEEKSLHVAWEHCISQGWGTVHRAQKGGEGRGGDGKAREAVLQVDKYR